VSGEALRPTNTMAEQAFAQRWDVSPDARRVLRVAPWLAPSLPTTPEGTVNAAPITVILNWTGLLED